MNFFGKRDVRKALDQLLQQSVLPVARRYHYLPPAFTALHPWKPLVLFIGNYSSGKSTLINELLGKQVQRTGQAPTDDSFTVIVGKEKSKTALPYGEVEIEEIPGSTLVNDETLPFSDFKRFGSRFVSHFVMKQVEAPILNHLALIDSPGMLDSIAELDRGYDYQAVIGRFAELADLVVLMFDPHRAGTIRETYDSIRSTLPTSVTDDRVMFVMNRIDECTNLLDLMKCYGSLCWNLSQMSNRKDIPRIYLTYSPKHGRNDPFLQPLHLERDEIKNKIQQAPRLQVNHWLGSVDKHLNRLYYLVQALQNINTAYVKRLLGFGQTVVLVAALLALVIDIASSFVWGGGLIPNLMGGHFSLISLFPPMIYFGLGIGGGMLYFRRHFHKEFVADVLRQLDSYVVLDTRYARDCWESVRQSVADLIQQPGKLGLFAGHKAALQKVARLKDQEVKRLYELHLREVPEPENQTAASMEHSLGPSAGLSRTETHSL